MKKMILPFIALSMLGFATPAQASGCYLCKGGGYVKFTTDDGESRKKAKACGCEIGGTRSECEAGNLKILCSVQNEKKDDFKWAIKANR